MFLPQLFRLLTVAGLLTIISMSCALAAPPVAVIKEVSDTLHGVVVKDPYRYFENVKSPEVQIWLKAQGEAAREALDKIAIRDSLEKRISELTDATGDSIREIVRMPEDRLYYMKRAKGERQFKLVMRVGLNGAERVLVDAEIAAMRTGVPHAVNYFVPSWDGRYVAYGMSAGGSEDTSLYLLDVSTGKLIGAPIPRVYGPVVHWLPDSRSLTFNQLKAPTKGEAESEAYLDTKVLWLKVGDAESKAKAVFGPTVTKNLGLARLDVGVVFFAPGSPWMIARTTDTTLQ